MSEHERLPIQLALEEGKRRQSPQTGLVALDLQKPRGTRRDTIPLFENFCFACALLRSRVAEQVLEGIALMNRLLEWTVEGELPLYLHEFPRCNDHSLALRLLPMFPLLRAECWSILPDPLQDRLTRWEQTILRRAGEQPSPSPGIQALPEAAQGIAPTWNPSSSEEWGDFLLAAQLSGSYALPAALQKQWHPYLGLLTGPLQRIAQEGPEPAPFLAELILALRGTEIPTRLLRPAAWHLHAALLDRSWSTQPPLLSAEDRCCAFPAPDFPVWTVWGSPKRLHTLAAHASRLESRVEQRGGETLWTLFLPEEEVEASAEGFFCSLYMDRHPAARILVDGAPATFFHPGDPLLIESGDRSFSLRIDLIEGEGRFSGHILFANRPHQLAHQSEPPYDAYDWRVALRTLERRGPCQLVLRLVANHQ